MTDFNALPAQDGPSVPTAEPQLAVFAGHASGLWRNLGLSRLERVKAHRDQFGSNLRTAIEAVDEDYGRQVSTGRARIADAASLMLEALQLVRHSTEWSCMESATQDAVCAAIAKATTAAETGAVGTSASE